jgi:hypothetical protein
MDEWPWIRDPHENQWCETEKKLTNHTYCLPQPSSTPDVKLIARTTINDHTDTAIVAHLDNVDEATCRMLFAGLLRCLADQLENGEPSRWWDKGWAVK